MSTGHGKRIIACRECHQKKVKCSGTGPPCTTCTELKIDCTYPPVRDKKTKVGQRYLEQILDENRRLSELVAGADTPRSISTATPAAEATTEDSTPRADNADRNPLVEEQPWFVPLTTVDLPVHIGEAADAAFATRLRQAVSTVAVSHMPRVNYMSDDTLRSLSQSPCDWPSACRLQFLVSVALKSITKRWHIVRQSAVRAGVDELIRDPRGCKWLTQCKISSLLAIGEAFTSRCALPHDTFPGSKYWARAMALIHIAPERPQLEVVEIYLLLGLYASCLNRRHTAVMLASSAVRLCVILGLHLDISESQLKDPVLREHRCRLWWSAYRYDRLWASKIGWPPSIPDESIEIRLPSSDNLPEDAAEDFGDAEYLVCTTRLAGMFNHAINTLYMRRRQAISFSERVQDVVRALRRWAEGLPDRLRLSPDDSGADVDSHVLYMHLAFNQAVIVLTRPILLHLLRQRRPRPNTNTAQVQFSESAYSLTTACIRCARQSMSLLKNSWTDGTFPTFDYFSTQFLFSAATILALSALLQGSKWTEDRDDFLLACSFLHQLQQNGNNGAKEFCTHADAVKLTLHEALKSDQADVVTYDTTRPTMTHDVPAFPTPSAQDFLSNPELDLNLIDVDESWMDWQDIFLPEMQLPQG